MTSGTHPAASGAFAKLLDVRVLEESPEGAVALALEAGADHERSGGIVHGGVMMSMLDMAMAGAVARTLAPDETTVSVNINTDFLAPARAGRLVATGQLARRGRTMAFPVGELRDAEGRLVARATGV